MDGSHHGLRNGGCCKVGEPARVLFDAAARDDQHNYSDRSLRGTSRGSSRAASGGPPPLNSLQGRVVHAGLLFRGELLHPARGWVSRVVRDASALVERDHGGLRIVLRVWSMLIGGPGATSTRFQHRGSDLSSSHHDPLDPEEDRPRKKSRSQDGMLRPIREPHPKRRRVVHVSTLYKKCGACADMRWKGTPATSHMQTLGKGRSTYPDSCRARR